MWTLRDFHKNDFGNWIPVQVLHLTHMRSRVDGIHDGFDKKKQAVKLADVYGIEKV